MATFSKRHPRYSTGRGTKRSSIRARRTSSGGPTPVRRRGPAPVFIILGVIVAGVVCWVMGKGCGGSQEARQNDRLRTYASTTNPIIERSGAIGQQFDTLRNSINGKSRDEPVRKMQQMVSDSKEIVVESQKVKPPEKASQLQPILQMTFDLRARGLEKFSSGMTDVLDKKNTEQAVTQMQQGLMDLVVADEALQRYRGDLDAKIKAAKSGDLGGVQIANPAVYVPKQDDALLAGVNEYVGHLAGTDTGSEIHGLALTGLSTSPARKDTTESGEAVLTFNTSFSATAAVQNQGNQEEENIQVVATLATTTGATPQQQVKKITMLKPNETTSLVFDRLKPEPGNDKVNTLKIVAGPVLKERRVENNEKTFKFIMLPQGG